MFFINCVYLLKYLLNICYKIFKLMLSIISIHICLNFFEIFLFFINFAKTINFRSCFTILFLLSLINFSNINLFKSNLENRINKKLLLSCKAKTLIA